MSIEEQAQAPPAPAALRDYIAVYDDALDSATCARMIEIFEALVAHQSRNGQGMREGLEDSGWTELNITSLALPEFNRLFEGVVLRSFERYNATLKLSQPISPLRKLADLMMKRYDRDRGDRFQVHFDSIRAHCNRYLVFLWYLNDVAEGGETVFPDLGVRVAPKAGRLVVFPPYWLFQHAGLPPLSEHKYIVSTYALY